MKVEKTEIKERRMGSISEGKNVVCVTGANGYIASWLVKFLLLRGYIVKATVRNLSKFAYNLVSLLLSSYLYLKFKLCVCVFVHVDDPEKVEHLLKLEGAKERLHLIKANLMEQGSFDSAIEGCEGVFHTASPCILDAKDPQVLT